ncbi:MAG: MATE family efflux transporter, partial [Elainellaceae cyanobacterium]
MTTQSSQYRLVAESRRCLALALPLIGAQLAQAATGFVDTLMMGRLGREQLAAGALGSLLFMELLVVGTNLVATSSSFIAEAYGAQRPERAGRWLNQGVWLAVVIAIPLALVMWNSQPWLRLLGQQPAVITLAGPYLRAASVAYLPALVFVALRSFVSALFQPRIVVVLTLCGVALNIIADEVLAFGRWGFPRLGLAGIGWSTAFIYWSMALGLVVYVLSQRRFDQYRPLRGLH